MEGDALLPCRQQPDWQRETGAPGDSPGRSPLASPGQEEGLNARAVLPCPHPALPPHPFARLPTGNPQGTNSKILGGSPLGDQHTRGLCTLASAPWAGLDKVTRPPSCSHVQPRMWQCSLFHPHGSRATKEIGFLVIGQVPPPSPPPAPEGSPLPGLAL